MKSWQTRRRDVLGLAALSLADAMAPAALAAPPDLGARVDAYVQPYLAVGQFSGVVLIAKDGRVLVEKAYGWADPRGRRRMGLNTRFRIASLSKAFTGAAIVRLAHDGKLSFDDSLAKFYPAYPNAEHITIDELLRHTSGVGEFEDQSVYAHRHTIDQLVAEAARAKPQFAPGQGDSYSNEGYVLLAKVVERASGESFGAYLKERFFKPLHMTSTGLEGPTPPLGRAIGTRAVLGGAPLPIDQDEAPLWGASGLYSDAHDLQRWLQAVRRGAVVDLHGLKYPYGWGRRAYQGHKLIEQSGMVEGFSSYMASYEDGWEVVVLSNVQSGMQERLGPDMAAVLFATPPTRPLRITAVAGGGDLGAIAGDYKNPDIGYPFRLRLEGGRLSSTWGPFPFWRPVSAVDADHLFIVADYSLITLKRDAAGHIVGLTMQTLTDDAPTDQGKTEFTRA